MTGDHVDRAGSDGGFRFAWPFPKGRPSAAYKFASYCTLAFVRSLSRIMFFAGMNKLEVHNAERFVEILKDRSRPLVTITNHRCNIDDPLMWSFLSWPQFFATIDRQRYTLAAHNICFTKQWHTTMFALGRCVPCVRGEGVFQKGMDFSVEKLNESGWVHIFPEGKVTKDPQRFKWGVGRLIMEPKVAPIILPIWMKGMNDVWPSQPPYYPIFGEKVEIWIGEPWDTSSFRTAIQRNSSTLSERQLRKLSTDKCQEILYGLGEKIGCLGAGTVEQIRRANARPLEDFA